MQHFGVKSKDHYGMLWYFWNGQLFVNHARPDILCWISPNKLNRLRIDYGHGRTLNLRDGPLEHLWGEGGAGEVQKKYSRKGKLNETKFMQAY